MTLELIQTVALLLALSLLHGFSLRCLATRPRLARLASGVIFGTVCIIGMMIPINLAPGVIVDGRSVLLSMAALFGGPVTGLIAGAIAGAYRLWLGGSGMVVGTAVIALAVALGLAYRTAWARGWLDRKPINLLAFGVALHALSMVMIGLVPGQSIAKIYATLGMPYLLIMGAATTLLGLLLQDLEVRQNNERALRERKARLRAIASAVPDILFVLDENGRYLEVMTHDEALLYRETETVLGRRLQDVLPEPVGARVMSAIQQAIHSGAPAITEYELDTPKGRRIFEGRIQAIDGQDASRTVVLIVQDVTDRALLEQERRIAAIAFESQQGMMVTDASNRILRVNKAFTQVTGYASEEVIGKPSSILSSGRHDEAFYRELWQQLNEHDMWEGEVWNRRRNGDVYPERLSISAVRDDSGVVTHYVGCFTDITQSKASEEEIHALAYYDHLTGLANRRLLTDRLHQALAHSHRDDWRGALMFIDLDDFKNINDLLGHHAGDELLTQAATRLRAAVRETDTVSRFGGDEFVVLVEQLPSDEVAAAATAERLAAKLLDQMGASYAIGNQHNVCTASIGIAMFGGQKQTVDELMQSADLSMYEAKRQGKNQIRFFDPVMQRTVSERLQLEKDLREALSGDQFELHYQAQCDADGTIDGVEALARWRHPTRGLVPPGVFIAAAERCGYMQALGQKLLEMACIQLGRWAGDPRFSTLRLSVNMSAIQLYGSNFAADTCALLERTGCPADRLVFELTESMLISDMEGAIQTMEALRKMGIRFSIDDFGTGYSSLAYLQRLPLDELKIDRSFVHDLPDNASSLAIVKTIVALARTLGLRVIAEGVEEPRQLETLMRNGCTSFQGFMFHCPTTIEAFEAQAHPLRGAAPPPPAGDEPASAPRPVQAARPAAVPGEHP
ncbi:EAL domain-containing protein [Thauera sp.]|jgi:diguanylate cyclase (GGDEF)-like protein/PAS domain S-box-containing protein|uniref:EAL domain-containing protein n=1 Tax=Thauera sp. TaxID=1905334 RepID=UPI002A3720AC|nr:EAL domain-containing protein [Thauera sp.]MDX9885755.1 EAL domain-containing protein [Thauera sp.]